MFVPVVVGAIILCSRVHPCDVCATWKDSVEKRHVKLINVAIAVALAVIIVALKRPRKISLYRSQLRWSLLKRTVTAEVVGPTFKDEDAGGDPTMQDYYHGPGESLHTTMAMTMTLTMKNTMMSPIQVMATLLISHRVKPKFVNWSLDPDCKNKSITPPIRRPQTMLLPLLPRGFDSCLSSRCDLWLLPARIMVGLLTHLTCPHLRRPLVGLRVVVPSSKPPDKVATGPVSWWEFADFQCCMLCHD